MAIAECADTILNDSDTKTKFVNMRPVTRLKTLRELQPPNAASQRNTDERKNGNLIHSRKCSKKTNLDAI